MYIFKGNFTEMEMEYLKELIIEHKDAIDEDGGCSFTGLVDAYVKKDGYNYYISNENIFVK